MVKYDVIIAGGGTAGCSAAWNCARLGLNTLLIESENYLGGTMTGGLVVPVMKSGDHQINTDFYDELISEMKDIGAQITYQDNRGWFNPIVLKDVLYKMLANAGIKIILNCDICTFDIKTDGNKILSLYSSSIYTDKSTQDFSNLLSEYIEAKYFVDCTGDLNFSQKVGCEFLTPPNEFPPVSLRFIMSGVDRKVFGDWLLEVDSDREVTTVERIDSQVHLSTAYTWDKNKKWALTPYFVDAVSKNILKDTDRNYFQIFSVAGTSDSIAFNCPRILDNLNPFDKTDLVKAKEEGIQAILRLAEFCKIYFPGFRNAYISKIADKVGIRESRQIKGKYVYTIEDLRSGKKFDRPVLISNYPVDVHSREKDSSTLEFDGEYQLPIESLMSADFENLFIAGRGLSADNKAQGALRVQSSCFSMGEAIAKYLASA